jgi:hypothetical protein
VIPRLTSVPHLDPGHVGRHHHPTGHPLAIDLHGVLGAGPGPVQVDGQAARRPTPGDLRDHAKTSPSSASLASCSRAASTAAVNPATSTA